MPKNKYILQQTQEVLSIKMDYIWAQQILSQNTYYNTPKKYHQRTHTANEITVTRTQQMLPTNISWIQQILSTNIDYN